MEVRQVVLGIAILLVFWAYQNGYANSLGTTGWFVGIIIFTLLLWSVGKVAMPKQPAEQKELWMFASAFAIVSTFVISFLGPMLGAVFPPNFSPSQLTPLVLSLWLMVYGGAMFVGGWQMKNGIPALIGVIWLFSALHFVTAVGTGPNSYLHFGLVTGLAVILAGLLRKG